MIIWKTPTGIATTDYVLERRKEAIFLITGAHPDWVYVGETNELPDEYFCDAWTCGDTPELSIDIDKARTVHLNKLRIQRNEKLAALDLPMMRAVGVRDEEKIVNIESQKQELRDMPDAVKSALTAAQTADEIKAINPLKSKESHEQQINHL